MNEEEFMQKLDSFMRREGIEFWDKKAYENSTWNKVPESYYIKIDWLAKKLSDDTNLTTGGKK